MVGNTTYAILSAEMTLTLSTIDVANWIQSCLKYASICFYVKSYGILLNISFIIVNHKFKFIQYCFHHSLMVLCHLGMSFKLIELYPHSTTHKIADLFSNKKVSLKRFKLKITNY